MRALAAALASVSIFAAACDNSTPARHVVTAAKPVRSASDLSCSLPIRVANRFGFVDFPSGQFRADPSAPAAEQSVGRIYAHGARRWVLVTYGLAEYQLSPDETEMVAFERVTGTATFPTGIALVNLSTNQTRHLATLPGPGARILGWLSDGIYILGASIYRVDPSTGHVTEIKVKPGAATDLWFWVTPYAAWSSLIAGPNQGDQDSVRSISLSDGSVTTWYTAPPTRSVSIVGFVGPSTPLVIEYNTEPYDRMTGKSFMLLTRPGTLEKLNFDTAIAEYGVTDSFGVWLTSPGHLWLYDSAGLLPMATLPTDFGGTPGLGGTLGIAGFCR